MGQEHIRIPPPVPFVLGKRAIVIPFPPPKKILHIRVAIIEYSCGYSAIGCRLPSLQTAVARARSEWMTPQHPNRWLAMEKGVRRWVVDISKWDPHPPHFSFALSLLPSHEHSAITRFIKMEDKKRALVSRMLQYALVCDVLEIPFGEIIIKRTSEGKPYLDYDKFGHRFPNFNFNVSHHGDYVAIASEPVCLVGLDIVSYAIPQGETITEFIQFFSSYFSCLEWYNIVNAGTSDDVLIEFYRYWSLKEAYVKAIGSGLTEDLNKVEFSHTCWTDIMATVDGKAMTEWRFWLFELGERHCVSIAKGHPRSAAMNYKSTLKKVDFTEDEYHLGLHLPSVDFVELGVEQLVSDLRKAIFECKHRS